MEDTPISAELVPIDSRALTAADLEVSEATAELARAGISDNTRRAYRRWWERFTKWCVAHGRTPLPATPQTFAEFVGQLAREDQAAASIKQAMSAVRTAHRKAGYPKGTPNNEGALDVLRGHQRQRAIDGKGRQKKAPPIVADALLVMLDTCSPAALIGRRDRLLLLLGIALMGRRSELAALTFDDIAVSEEGLTVYIRQSKTDQAAIGEEVAVPRGTKEKTDPVRALLAWRDSLARFGITSGPLLRHVKDGRPVRAMTGHDVNTAIRRIAKQAKLPDAGQYTAHALRAGGATMAYKAGAPISAIARQGRWKDGSAVVLGYIRAVDKWKDNPMRDVL